MAILPDLLAARFLPGVARADDPLEEGAASRAESRRELGLLYEVHAPRVRRFLRDVLRDDALAWDATQETFARAHDHLARLRNGEAAPWLFGVARNVSREMRRSQVRAARVFVPTAGAVTLEARTGTSSCPEAGYLAREALTVIDAALSKLSEDRRAVLLLRLDHGLAYEEIAEAMGWSIAKVRVEIFRAREVLREAMRAGGHAPDERDAHDVEKPR